MHDFAADLDQLVPQGRQRPVFHTRRQRQPPQEVAQVVRQGKQLQPRLVVHEVMATQPRPVQSQLALLDALLSGAADHDHPGHAQGCRWLRDVCSSAEQ